MRSKRFLALLGLLLFSISCFANKPEKTVVEQHIEVSMRMIGHQVLLSKGDSVSRVLPIERDANKFRIRFENQFGFHPDSLAAIIDGVILETGIAESYIVQVLTCDSGLVAHSYEVGNKQNVLACSGRVQPLDCYELQITLISNRPEQPTAPDSADSTNGILVTYSEPLTLMGLLILVVFILAGMVLFLKNRKKYAEPDPDIIQLGDYTFKRRTMELIRGNERIELTSKECDLLQLLYQSVNDTVERDTILRMVWNDEGDYVGRTLDVFISKLRKKLEADSRIKIANIRGVGYKLIIDA
jgi:hypothetical protein